ncbi:hypothetical protein D8062_09820 [Staphylococcus aureus]|uniref:hypothetical protein n=1 Tax=Staphylococcus aureus TaxID=1280 RepID=UPI000F25F2F1|nr:hypothetical protein [Staphylococcus aureus]RLL56391.1 hypothetical protein D8062_09820 [Staphylococcus aureus]
MKIKTKKQLNLPQLIEWAMDNDIKHRVFESNPNFDGVTYRLGFDKGGDLYFEESLAPTLLFTVEVEEEITEDTEIPKLMTTFEKTCLEGDFGYQRVRIDENYPIKLMLNKAEAHGEPVETLHVVNDDDTHTLIWRDGRLIE